MTKRQLIEQITDLNPTAKPAFLAEFKDADLAEYLQHLRWADQPQYPWQTAQGSSRRDRPAAESMPAEPAVVDVSAVTFQDDPAEMDEPVAVAVGTDTDASAPFAEDDSQEDSQAWLL